MLQTWRFVAWRPGPLDALTEPLRSTQSLIAEAIRAAASLELSQLALPAFACKEPPPAATFRYHSGTLYLRLYLKPYP